MSLIFHNNTLKRNQVTLWIVNDVTGKGTFNQERPLKFLVTAFPGEMPTQKL